MDPAIYKTLHYVGMIVLFTGLGSLVAADLKKPSALRLPASLHGIGLLLILVSGFAMQAKLNHLFGTWLVVKILILLVLSGFIMVIKRQLLPTPVIYLLIVILGSIAAYLGFSNSILLQPL